MFKLNSQSCHIVLSNTRQAFSREAICTLSRLPVNHRVVYTSACFKLLLKEQMQYFFKTTIILRAIK